MIRKCLEAKDRGDDHIVAWVTGRRREFLYVEDAAEGILLAAERYNASDPVNLGSSFEISIRELTETIARLVGFAGQIEWDTSKPNGQPRRKLDVSRCWIVLVSNPLLPLKTAYIARSNGTGVKCSEYCTSWVPARIS